MSAGSGVRRWASAPTLLLLHLLAGAASAADECLDNLVCSQSGQDCRDPSTVTGDWECACRAPLQGSREGGLAACSFPRTPPPPGVATPAPVAAGDDDDDTTLRIVLIVAGAALLTIVVGVTLVLLCASRRAAAEADRRARAAKDEGRPLRYEEAASPATASTAPAPAPLPAQAASQDEEAHTAKEDPLQAQTALPPVQQQEQEQEQEQPYLQQRQQPLYATRVGAPQTPPVMPGDFADDDVSRLFFSRDDGASGRVTPPEHTKKCMVCGRESIMVWAERCPRCGATMPPSPSPQGAPSRILRPSEVKERQMQEELQEKGVKLLVTRVHSATLPLPQQDPFASTPSPPPQPMPPTRGPGQQAILTPPPSSSPREAASPSDPLLVEV
eukprot:Rhum_TRINITY_DN11043_c0_g1::Rhum_TRINITY_DN11043_c0_g1_i1::g.42054::m.42054